MVFIPKAGWYIRVWGSHTALICCNCKVTNNGKVYKVLFSERFVKFSSNKIKNGKKI